MKNSGEAFIILLALIAVVITLAGAVVSISIVNTLGGSKIQQGMLAADIAESGAENAILRLLRDPNYTGETLPIGNGQAVITVTGTPSVITSTGTLGSFQRKIEVTASVGDTLTIVSWKEIP